MNLAHLHLILNHFPTIGMTVGIGLFVVALLSKSDDLRRASLGVFLVIALLSIPAYTSGNAAEEVLLADNPDVAAVLISRHQDAALIAFMFMGMIGIAAWFGLWEYRRYGKPAGWNTPVVLVLSALTLGLMARAGSMGGEILHPEIRPDLAVAQLDTTPGLAATIGNFLVERTWVWPASETVHFIGLWLLLGIVLLVNLRLLGLVRGIPFSTLHRLLPWAVLGFVINTITGMLFFIGAPSQYTTNPSFHFKIIFMMAAGINAIYFTIFEEPWNLGADDVAPMRAKVVAGSTIVFWVGVIYFGRMLPFLGLAF
jgi:hypothetical protein